MVTPLNVEYMALVNGILIIVEDVDYYFVVVATLIGIMESAITTSRTCARCTYIPTYKAGCNNSRLQQQLQQLQQHILCDMKRRDLKVYQAIWML